MKIVRFTGSSQDDLRDFPADPRRQAGFDLYAIQRGLEPSDWKPMESCGNIFADLDFPPEEATILHMRATLLNDVRQFVTASGTSAASVAAQ